ncbi:MAG TPA: trigger factor [Bacteroidales bacterium]|nr:trigger factor [Bacteroidales bacterium]
MNITKENIDELNAILKVQVSSDDYSEKVNELLKDYKKKASIKGFRPGKVPFGIIKKMYGPSVKLDEINKIVSEGINKYINEEKIDILGDPLPLADENESIDFENDDRFTFSFELGLAPEFQITLTKKVKMTCYEIKIDRKLRQGFIDNYARKFGDYSNVEEVAPEDIIKARIEQIDDSGSLAEDGLSAENSSLSVSVIKDEEIRKSFIGRKKGESVDFDIRKAYPNNYEIAAILQMKKEETTKVGGTFRAVISEISRFTPAACNQELFDKVYGEGAVKSEDEFISKLDEEIASQLSTESNYKALTDAKKLAVEKSSFNLPQDFLKRWLLKVNKELSEEEIDKDFEKFLEDLKWQLIRNRIARDNEIKIGEEDLLDEARNYTRQQFQQYGLYYAADEQVDKYAKEMLRREEDQKKIADKILEEKVIEKIKEMVKVETVKVTADEFNKLFTS